METVLVPINAATISLVVILFGNISVLVWGAAVLSTRLASLSKEFGRTAKVIDRMEERQEQHAHRLLILEQAMKHG